MNFEPPPAMPQKRVAAVLYAFFRDRFPVGLVFRLTGEVSFYKNNKQINRTDIIACCKALLDITIFGKLRYSN